MFGNNTAPVYNVNHMSNNTAADTRSGPTKRRIHSPDDTRAQLFPALDPSYNQSSNHQNHSYTPSSESMQANKRIRLDEHHQVTLGAEKYLNPPPSAPTGHYIINTNISQPTYDIGNLMTMGTNPILTNPSTATGTMKPVVPLPKPAIELPSLEKIDVFDADRLRKIDCEFAQSMPGMPTIQQKMLFHGPDFYRIYYYWIWDNDMQISVASLTALSSRYRWISDIGFNPSGNTCCLEINKQIGISSACFCDSCRRSCDMNLYENNIITTSAKQSWFQQRGPEYIANNFGPRFYIEVKKGTEEEKNNLRMTAHLEALTATIQSAANSPSNYVMSNK